MVRALLVAAGIVGLLLALPNAEAQADPAPPSGLPACIRVATQSRWVPYGYNHIVIIEDGCSKAATCTVSTDINPQPQTAEIPSGQTVEVVTFMGANAMSFVAKVTCTLH